MLGWAVAEALGLLVLDAALVLCVWLALLGLTLILCRQPARRCTVARLAVVGCLALLPLTAAWPARSGHSLLSTTRSLLQPQNKKAAPIAGHDSPVASKLVPAPLIESGGSFHASWLRAGGFLYAAGAALHLAWFVLTRIAAAWLIRSTQKPSPGVRLVHQDLFLSRSGAAAGAHVTTRVAVSKKISRPAVVGVLRPTILLPAYLDRPDDIETVRWVLRHEQAHANAHDPLFALLGDLARAVWFFLPPVWFFRRQLLKDQEYIADQIAAGHSPIEHGIYAETLLKLASKNAFPSVPDRFSPSPPTGSTEQLGGSSSSSSPRIEPSGLFQRVWVLLKSPVSVELASPGWWRVCSWSLGLASLVVLSHLDLLTPAASSPRRLKLPPAAIQVRQLSLTGSQRPGDGWVYTRLPIPLPHEFTLRFEYQGVPDDLRDLVIAGARIHVPAGAIDRAGDPPSPGDDPPDWQVVVIEWTSRGPSAWVNRQPVAVRGDPPPAVLEIGIAPGKSATLRNLSLNLPPSTK